MSNPEYNYQYQALPDQQPQSTPSPQNESPQNQAPVNYQHQQSALLQLRQQQLAQGTLPSFQNQQANPNQLSQPPQSQPIQQVPYQQFQNQQPQPIQNPPQQYQQPYQQPYQYNPNAQPLQPPPYPANPNQKQCPACTFLNNPQAQKCQVCNTPLPNQLPAPQQQVIIVQNPPGRRGRRWGNQQPNHRPQQPPPQPVPQNEQQRRDDQDKVKCCGCINGVSGMKMVAGLQLVLTVLMLLSGSTYIGFLQVFCFIGMMNFLFSPEKKSARSCLVCALMLRLVSDITSLIVGLVCLQNPSQCGIYGSQNEQILYASSGVAGVMILLDLHYLLVARKLVKYGRTGPGGGRNGRRGRGPN